MAKRIENVGEYNARTITFSFESSDGSVAIPSVVEWRMTCPDDDDSVVADWATVTATTTTNAEGSTVCSVTVSVGATLHAMVTTDKVKEERALIVSADRDTSTEFNEEFRYYVERRSARS